MSLSATPLPITSAGSALVMRSEIAKPWSSTRAASLIAALDLSRPKVAIWATRSAPYFSVT